LSRKKYRGDKCPIWPNGDIEKVEETFEETK